MEINYEREKELKTNVDDFFNWQFLCKTSNNIFLTIIKKLSIKKSEYMNIIFIIQVTSAVDSELMFK